MTIYDKNNYFLKNDNRESLFSFKLTVSEISPHYYYSHYYFFLFFFFFAIITISFESTFVIYSHYFHDMLKENNKSLLTIHHYRVIYIFSSVLAPAW